MSTATVRLDGIEVLDPRVADYAKTAVPLAPGQSWPTDLQAAKLQILPALVDLSCRLGEPGPPHPANIGSELRAALRGGFGTVLLNPDTQPVIDQAAVIEWIERRAATANGAHLRLIGAMTKGLDGSALANMSALHRSGVVGLGHGDRPLPGPEVLLNAMRYARELGLRLHLTPSHPALAAGLVASGPVAADFGLAGTPVATETLALGQIIALVEDSGCPVHIGRLATATGVEWLRWAKSRGLPVSADVSLHHLLLNTDAVADFRNHAHLRPPLRAEADRQALLRGLSDGTIDAICSDHRPQPADAYQGPLADTPAGNSAFDTFLSQLLTHPDLIAIPLERRLDACCDRPAAIAGLSNSPAVDAVLFDPDCRWPANADGFHSHCHNTPWPNQALQGRCRGVIIKGELTLFADTDVA